MVKDSDQLSKYFLSNIWRVDTHQNFPPSKFCAIWYPLYFFRNYMVINVECYFGQILGSGYAYCNEILSELFLEGYTWLKSFSVWFDYLVIRITKCSRASVCLWSHCVSRMILALKYCSLTQLFITGKFHATVWINIIVILIMKLIVLLTFRVYNNYHAIYPQCLCSP